MAYHYLWLSSSPELADHLRRANEERSAAAYRTLSEIGKTVSVIKHAAVLAVDWFGRRIRERAALRELSALDDRSLKDIGVARGEIARIARAYADGVAEPRGFAAQSSAASGPTPAWLRGVYDGGQTAEPRAARDDTHVNPAYDAPRSAAQR